MKIDGVACKLVERYASESLWNLTSEIRHICNATKT